MGKIQQRKQYKLSSIIGTFYNIESGLKQYLMRFMLSSQDIEDIVQETFLRAWESEKSREIRSPKSFLFKVAKNIALSEISRKASHLTIYMGDLEELNVLDGNLSAEENLEIHNRLKALSVTINSLPPQCRKVLVMRKVLGFSHHEIARRMNLSTRTVEKHLTKGLQRCQQSHEATDQPGQIIKRAGVE